MSELHVELASFHVKHMGVLLNADRVAPLGQGPGVRLSESMKLILASYAQNSCNKKHFTKFVWLLS